MKLIKRLKFKFTIRTTLVLWVGLSALSVIGLSIAGLMSNHLLSETQAELTERALPLENVSLNMGLDLINYMRRQTEILSAPDSKALAVVDSRDSLDSIFTSQLEQLRALIGKDTSNQKTYQQLSNAYRNFLVADDKLYTAISDSLRLQQRLDEQTKSIEHAVESIQNNANAVAGKINFDVQRAKRKIKRSIKKLPSQILSAEDLQSYQQFQQLVEDSIFGSQANAQKFSADIRANVVMLATIVQQVKLEKSADMLTSIESNRVNQLVKATDDAIVGLSKSLEYNNALKSQVAALQDEFENLAQLVSKGEGSVFNLRRRFIVASEQLFAARKAVDLAESQMLASFHDLSSSVHEIAAAADAQAKSVILKNSASALAIGIIVTLITVLLGVLVFLRITRPLDQARVAIKAAAEGDLTHRIPARNQQDEFSALANDLNEFSENTQNLVTDIQNHTDQVSSASRQLASITHQTSDDIARQKKEIELLSNAMQDMSDSVALVDKHSLKANEGALEAENSSKRGKVVVTETIDSIHRLAEEIESTARIIDDLNQDSEAIGSVLDVIRGVAEQTNLLALNAAIEAARAGEQGRGFAVVADEVRTLAVRTQESTEEIQSIIQNVQNRISKATDTVSESHAGAQTTVTNAAQAGESLDAITQAITSIREMSAEISRSTHQQTIVASEVEHNMDTIREVAGHATEATMETALSSETLAESAKELSTLVSRFKI